MLGTGKKKTSVKDIRIFDESKICKGRGDILGARVLLCSWTLEKLPGFRSSVSGWPELCLRTQGSRWKISKGRNPGVGFWRPGPDTELLARGFFSDIGVLRLRDSGHHGALSSRLSPGAVNLRQAEVVGTPTGQLWPPLRVGFTFQKPIKEEKISTVT